MTAYSNHPQTDTVRSGPLPSGRARGLVLHLEQLGVDGERIRILRGRPASMPATSRADRRAVARPARRVAIGAGIGAGVTLVLALAAVNLWDLNVAAVIMAAVIIGVLVGGLAALYSRLAATPDAYDLDSGGLSIVEARLDGLDRDKAEQLVSVVAAAGGERR